MPSRVRLLLQSLASSTRVGSGFSQTKTVSATVVHGALPTRWTSYGFCSGFVCVCVCVLSKWQGPRVSAQLSIDLGRHRCMLQLHRVSHLRRFLVYVSLAIVGCIVLSTWPLHPLHFDHVQELRRLTLAATPAKLLAGHGRTARPLCGQS